MNAFSVEAGNALTQIMPQDIEERPVTYEEIQNVLNTEFVKEFQGTLLIWEVLRELVFGADLLEEMSGVVGFPQNRILNTPDIEAGGWDVVLAFNTMARRLRESSLFGIAVNRKVAAYVKEFLDDNYLYSISKVFLETGKETLEFTLDGHQMRFTLNRNYVKDYGLLTYENIKSGVKVLLPFHKSRCNSAH